MEQFSPEIVAILAVGVAIAGLVLQQGRRIDALSMRMDEQDRRTDDRFRQMGDQVNEQFRNLSDQMNERFRNLSDRVARVEGKLDLLETFITRRNEPPVTPAE